MPRNGFLQISLEPDSSCKYSQDIRIFVFCFITNCNTFYQVCDEPRGSTCRVWSIGSSAPFAWNRRAGDDVFAPLFANATIHVSLSEYTQCQAERSSKTMEPPRKLFRFLSLMALRLTSSNATRTHLVLLLPARPESNTGYYYSLLSRYT